MGQKRLLPRSAANLAQLMAGVYGQAHQRAAQGIPVAWIAIIVPVELLHGFDLVIAVPENHAAACAAKGAGPELCQVAEAAGYSMDLCSYARIDLGTSLGHGQGSPTMGLPKPDILISDNNNCSLLVKWFDTYRRAQGTPHFVLDVPFCRAPQRPRDTAYIAAQLAELIRFIEELTGQRHDMDKTRQAMEYSRQTHALWKRLLGLAAQHPAGITAFDTFAHMAPFITNLRGTKAMVEHLELVCAEAEEQMAAGLFPVPEERYRLLWDNIAPWHQLRAMSSRLAGLGANIISASYTSCIGSLEGETELHDLGQGDPLTALARIQNFSVCPHGLHLRARSMTRAVDALGIDGVVFSSNRSCKVYSVMQMDLMEMIGRHIGTPCVMIDVDHADSRKYDEQSAFLRIEALLEAIDASRA